MQNNDPDVPRISYPTPDPEYVSIEFMAENLPNDFSENYLRAHLMMKTEDSKKAGMRNCARASCQRNKLLFGPFVDYRVDVFNQIKFNDHAIPAMLATVIIID